MEKRRNRNKQEQKQFNYLLYINEMDTNTRMPVYYTQKGAEFWDWLARRGYVALIPYSGHGYYYHFAQLKKGLEKAWEEGLTKKGGYFYEPRYYF